MIERIAAGVVVAGIVAVVAMRAGSLSRSGAIAATITGTIAITAGWGWGALLIGYFVSSSALTRLGAAAKEARTGAIVEKGGARDAWQVLANGGVFALAALASIVTRGEGRPAAWAAVAGAGALSAAAADTWSTEIGTLLGGEPRLVTSWRRVPAGSSGGVTAWGTAGALLGASVITALAVQSVLAPAGLPASSMPVVLASGVFGAFVDSLLGATVQLRRHCPRCDRATERTVHDCGAATRATGGWAWMTNDTVNALATVAGALPPLVAALWAGEPC